MRACVDICSYACLYICTCTYVDIYVYLYKYASIYIYIQVHVCVYIYVFIYVCVCINMCVCVCVRFVGVVDPKRENSKYFKMNSSTKFCIFKKWIFLHECMFPTCCFRQRTYVIQGHINRAPNET